MIDFEKFKVIPTNNREYGLYVTNTNSGLRIRFSKSLADRLGIKEGCTESLQFLIAEDLLAIGFDLIAGAQGHKVKRSNGQVIMYNSRLAQAILKGAEVQLETNKTICFSDVTFEPKDDLEVAFINLK